MEETQARAVIDLAVRAGVALLATGSSAADVVATVLALTKAYGLTSVHVDVTFSSVFVSYFRGPHADPITVMRVVKSRTQDFTRLGRLRDLIRALANEPVDVAEARAQFDAVFSAPHPYRRWVVIAANGLLAAAVAVLIGGKPLVVFLSTLTSLAVSITLFKLSRIGVSKFFAQVVAAALPTLVATAVVFAARSGASWATDVSPSLIVATGIVLLLAGLQVVGAAEDALEGYYVTAGARSFEVVVLTLGIVVGITLVLAVGQRLELPMSISTYTLLDGSLVTQVVCAALISIAFAVTAYAPPRTAVAAALAGAVGWLIYSFVGRAGIGVATAGAVAAIVLGFTAHALGRRLGVGAMAVTTAAIVPLLPGRAVYQGISEIVTMPSGVGMVQGLPTLAGAVGIALGLAAGVALGTYLARILGAWRAKRPLRPDPGSGVADP